MSERVRSSEFMLWAKTEGRAAFHLGSSGVANYVLADLPFSSEDLEITGNGFYGYEPLVREIARKCNVESSRVFSTIGTSLANHIAMATIIDDGDEILMELPTYELLVSTARYLGADVKRFHRRLESWFQIDTAEIARLVSRRTKLIVLTNLHNPTSALTSEDVLQEIGRIARRVGAYVLVDEVYLDAAFDHPHPSAIHLGDEFIVTNSLTKVYGLSGLRCGWVLAKPELITAMWRLNDLFDVLPPHPSERLSVIAFRDLDRIKERARTILTANHKAAACFLCARRDLQWFNPGFGTVLFPKLKSGTVESLYARLRDRYETSIAPGRFFEMPDHFRIGLGIEPELFQEGLRRIGQALDTAE